MSDDDEKKLSACTKSDAIFSRLPMPQMSHDNIETWFIQLESWFAISGVKADAVKFNTVIASMNGKLLSQIHHSVVSPPEKNKYEHIKAALIANFADSEQQRIQKFVSGIQLGDKRPSHLLNELRKVGGTVDENLVKNLWMQRLPTQARSIIAAASGIGGKGKLDDLAIIADAVVESLTMHNIDLATTSASSINPSTSSIAVLEQRINSLTDMVAKLGNHSSRSRSLSRRSSKHRGNRDQTPNHSKTDSKEGVCWYHRKFKSNATRCTTPCTYSSHSSPSKN